VLLNYFPSDVLPRFTPEEQQLLKGSVDYLGINVYTSRFVTDGLDADMVGLSA
jgi:beta-glucosidase/6-phospho-beta-glucosidase/beta-galactosidase